jgi:hypothetical protein
VVAIATLPPATEPPVSTAPEPSVTVAAAAAAPQEPVSLSTVAPTVLKRASTAILDLHGAGLRAEHRAVVFRGRDASAELRVMRQRLVSPTLVQIVIAVDAAAPSGSYTLAVTDSEGHMSNSLRLDVAK